jgi:predicted ATPase
VNHPADFDRISKWVREAFPEIESLGTVVTQAGTTFLSSREKFLQSPITVFEASAGQLKFIALTSLIYSPFGAPMTCLEEPENHLHPRLLSLLVEMANQRKLELHGNVSQTIATTHSPYLVDLLEPEDIVLVSKQAGETKFRRVESGDELRKLIRESESTLGRLWFSGSLGDA